MLGGDDGIINNNEKLVGDLSEDLPQDFEGSDAKVTQGGGSGGEGAGEQ